MLALGLSVLGGLAVPNDSSAPSYSAGEWKRWFVSESCYVPVRSTSTYFGWSLVRANSLVGLQTKRKFIYQPLEGRVTYEYTGIRVHPSNSESNINSAFYWQFINGFTRYRYIGLNNREELLPKIEKASYVSTELHIRAIQEGDDGILLQATEVVNGVETVTTVPTEEIYQARLSGVVIPTGSAGRFYFSQLRLADFAYNAYALDTVENVIASHSGINQAGATIDVATNTFIYRG